jgi:decaprenyl-phosphate phosphoribosyltransferase
MSALDTLPPHTAPTIPTTVSPTVPPTLTRRARALARTTRPHQWVKNLVVLALPIVAGALTTVTAWLHLLLAFIAMCAASAGTYLVNDLADIAADRLHPTKRHRPIAAGTLSPRTAGVAASIAFGSALVLSSVAGPWVALWVLGYVGLTVAYTRWLKHLALIDVVVLALGFVVRVLVGAAAVGATAPLALLVAVFAGAMFVSLGKRAGERRRLGGRAAEHRRSLRWYRPDRTGPLMTWTRRIAVVAFAIWIAPVIGTLATLAAMAATTLILIRFEELVEQGRVDDPARVIVDDPVTVGALTVLAAVLAIGTIG